MASATQDKKTLNFIEVIRGNPCLYNTDLEDYRNVWRKSEIWQSISETFGYYDVEAAKMAWKKLRDNYRDALRRQSNPRVSKGHRGAKGLKQTKNWLYQSEMEFLLPFMSNRVPDNYLENIALDKLYRPVNPEVADPLGDDDASSAAMADESRVVKVGNNSPSYCEEPSPVHKRRRTEEPKTRKLAELEFWGSKRRSKEMRARERRKLIGQVLQKAESHTPLDQFFSSMCQTTKTFPLAHQLEVKRALFKVVTDIEEKLGGGLHSEATGRSTPSESSDD